MVMFKSRLGLWKGPYWAKYCYKNLKESTNKCTCHCDISLYPFPKQPLFFYVSALQSFENTLEKGLIDRNKQLLLFPKSFFYLFGDFPAILIIFKTVVCELFQIGRV